MVELLGCCVCYVLYGGVQKIFWIFEVVDGGEVIEIWL